MADWVALLYSVVLTPTRRVTSADLIQLATRLGFSDVKTVLSTGNLIFDVTGEEGELARRIEAEIARSWGKAIPVLLRSAQEWRAMVANNPFPQETLRDAAKVAVRVMRTDPEAEIVARIAARRAVDEGFAATPRALWFASPRQLSVSPLLRAIAAPKVGVGTLRNGSAIAKIAAALD